MSTKPPCEFNRIQANGAWNNNFISSNYFIVSAAAEVNHMPIQLAFVELTISDLMSNFKTGAHEIVTCSLQKEISKIPHSECLVFIH
jgi:predicted YcjX-like family ATPase